VIAAGVSFLTLTSTLAARYFGRRAIRRDAERAFEEQRKQLGKTLAEQRTRTLNERFATAAGGQLGSDKPVGCPAGRGVCHGGPGESPKLTLLLR